MHGSKDGRRALGAEGEAAVAAWYEAAGYQVLDRNWRVREGELDLVVTLGSVVVFCEVKTRSSDVFGSPAEAVSRQKQQRIRLLAARWFEQREGAGGGRQARFDVAAVSVRRGAPAVVEVIEAAF